MSRDVREHWQAGATAAAEVARDANRSSADDPGIPPPADLVAIAGQGHVSLTWHGVDGAMGYVVLAGDAPDDLAVLDHGGGDLLAVPLPPYVDTSGEPGRVRHYAVASLATVEGGHGEVGTVVAAAPLDTAGTTPLVSATIDADDTLGVLQRPWWMIGAEHLSTLRDRERPGPATVGEEYATALRRMADDVGVTHVRCHAILDEDNAVVVQRADRLEVDASRVIDLYERLASLGLRPIVELGFMPRALARDAEETVFTYEGIISPPTDVATWGRVVGAFVGALVDHFGIEEVRQWAFEVWNEPNLGVFWSGSRDDYFALYDEAVGAIRRVDEHLRVGGPATAAVGWIGAFLDHVVDVGSPLDFLATHVYGVPPLALRPALEARGLDHVATWWTEWGVTPTHFHPVNDAAFGAPFVLAGMKAASHVADALAYWVATDHFEELGRPPRLFHGGFGLQTVGNLRKPRYWALALAHQQGREQVAMHLSGDGAGGLVDGWATRHDDGTIDVLVWNGTLDQSRIDGDPLLDRDVRVGVTGAPGPCRVSVARIDDEHSNVRRHAPDDDWPDAAGWMRLQADDVLHVEDWGRHEAEDGVVEVTVALPMPGVVRVRLSPHPDHA
jgi:xylan 1,4-beta-xylosidase